ncbi:MAG: hypothetical protein ACXAC2_08610 [Candidatus Kariarchaeaceae archaeon]
MGQNKRKLVMVLTTIFIVQLLLNAIVYYGISYLQENRNLRFGYRLESVDFRDEVQLVRVSYDDDGFTLITREFSPVQTIFFERYNSQQNLLWVVNRSYFSINEYLASSSQYLVLCEHCDGIIDSNYTNSTSKIYTVYHNGELFVEDHRKTLFNISSKHHFYLETSYAYRLGKIFQDVMVIPTLNYLSFLDEQSNWIPDQSLVNVSLVYYDLISLQETSHLLESTRELSIHPYILRKTDTSFDLIKESFFPFSSHLAIFHGDVIGDNRTLTQLGEIDLTDPECRVSCDFYPNNRDTGPLGFIIHSSASQTQFDVVSLEDKRTWIYEHHQDWDFQGTYPTDYHFIISEVSTYSDRSIRIAVYDYHTNSSRIIPLLDYDGMYYWIYELFEFERNKIIIVIKGINNMFYDILLLTLDPRDLEGILFSTPFMPHLVSSILLIMVSFSIFYKRSKGQVVPERYPLLK